MIKDQQEIRRKRHTLHHCRRQTADGRWQMADGRWQMADGRHQDQIALTASSAEEEQKHFAFQICTCCSPVQDARQQGTHKAKAFVLCAWKSDAGFCHASRGRRPKGYQAAPLW